MSPTKKQIAPHAKRAESEDGAKVKNSDLTQALRPPPTAAAYFSPTVPAVQRQECQLQAGTDRPFYIALNVPVMARGDTLQKRKSDDPRLGHAPRPPPMAAARLDSATAESRARYMGDADPKNTEFDGTLMRPPAAARYLGLSESTLAKMRLRGDGPPYYKLGKRAVAYMRPELAEWAAKRRRQSTSEIVHIEGAS